MDSRFVSFERRMNQKFENFAGQIISPVTEGFGETASKLRKKNRETGKANQAYSSPQFP